MKVTVRQAVEGFQGLTSIGMKEIPPKAALKVARLIATLRAEATAYEKAQEKAYLNAGAELVSNGNLSILDPVRSADESEADYAVRLSAARKRMLDVKNDVEALLDTEIEIVGEPLPFTLFLNDKDPEKSATQKPFDLSRVLPFVTE